MLINETVEKIKSGELSAVKLVEDALANARKYQSKKNIFISFNEDEALEKAAEIDKKVKKGEKLGSLAGIPYALKDNFLRKGDITTSGSKILEDFRAPLTATSIERIENEDAIMIGRTNLDAFGHGCSTENSYFGVTKNAFDDERVAGGSSGGSAVAVALDIVPFAIGSDTGGSIRQPASFNGVIGVRPTYGAVSRFGMAAMISSTDTVGCFTHNSEDAKLIMKIMAGKDEKDSTSRPENIYESTPEPIKTIGLVKDFLIDGLDKDIKKATLDAVEKLKGLGYEVREVELPHVKHSLPTYYITMFAEVSSNLSRLDGVRYGLRGSNDSISAMYGKSRDEGFTPETKRRIMVGNYVLSSGFYDAYYMKAAKARTLIINDFNKALSEVDCLIGPLTPSPAFKVGEKTGDPVTMYLEDVLTVPAALAGLPNASVPAGKNKMGLPLSIGLIGRQGEDVALLDLVEKMEEK
jgi:aspartyl-tRNA(Asn)/glutamyl-tRNA(Gln) amidotransferase subunit A